MGRKEERQEEAKRHIALMNQVFANETNEAAKATHIYEDGEGRDLVLSEAAFESTETDVSTLFAASYIDRVNEKVVIVDAGSFTRPGGNYEGGSFGPEQALCAESNLYPILLKLKESYFDQNRQYTSGQLCTDRALFIPDVAFSKEGKVTKVDVVVIAAPHRTHAIENHRSEAECDLACEYRIKAALNIAAQSDANILLFPAFGCGIFGNDETTVCKHIRAWLNENPGVFKQIVFTVPRSSFSVFDKEFSKPKIEEVVVEEKEEEEDTFDFDLDDLPEGVTFR